MLGEGAVNLGCDETPTPAAADCSCGRVAAAGALAAPLAWVGDWDISTSMLLGLFMGIGTTGATLSRGTIGATSHTPVTGSHPSALSSELMTFPRGEVTPGCRSA